ncbi:MAG: putative integral rane protein [Actinomycetota bacterium]|jgi:uncharacterized membrane protein|nr:putative integral rane protein [Actinomycetota bacterium]
MEFGYYELLLVIHLLTVVVGIGSVVLNGVYGAQAKKAGPNGGNAIVRANFEVTKIAEIFIYLIPVTGILMVLKSDAFDFSDTWVWLSIVLYVIAVGNAHMNLIPGAKKMIELTQGPPTPEMESWGKRLAIAGTTNDLIVVALVVLMVWKPGTL